MNEKTERVAQSLFVILTVVVVILVAIFITLEDASARPTPPSPASRPLNDVNTISSEFAVIVDDFEPQPVYDDPAYNFNRLGGDRGVVNDSLFELGEGQARYTIAAGQTWGGAWQSLNHPIGEMLPIDFSAVLPPQIRPAYQSQISGITAEVIDGTPGATFRLELKDRVGVRQWHTETLLTGGEQRIAASLPPLADIKELTWVLDHGISGNYVILDSFVLTATTQITDTATAAFVWSYGMLLENMSPNSGLVRDKGRLASGQFDAIQATGSLAAATAVAAQLGVVETADARQIVSTISDTLLLDVPRHETGLWPHFVISQTGVITIAPGTEWSSVDTAIAATGLLDGQNGLGLSTSGTESMLDAIDWADMVHTTPTTGGISHGYSHSGAQLGSDWNIFGGETWLVELAYAVESGQATTLTYPSPPTANGSGFIDELAWLYVQPPLGLDYWGNNWQAYRERATYSHTQYYSLNYQDDCIDQLGLFGLSAAEAPVPSAVPPGQSIYQAFGVGGRFIGPIDGTKFPNGEPFMDSPAVIPHYSAMIASLRPDDALAMWNWLINEGPFSPLNNVESFMFPKGSNCDPDTIQWNSLKGSWNLALQTLGWGNYLVQREGQIPVTWQTTTQNDFLQQGYRVLIPQRSYLPIILKQ